MTKHVEVLAAEADRNDSDKAQDEIVLISGVQIKLMPSYSTKAMTAQQPIFVHAFGRFRNQRPQNRIRHLGRQLRQSVVGG